MANELNCKSGIQLGKSGFELSLQVCVLGFCLLPLWFQGGILFGSLYHYLQMVFPLII